MFDSITFHTNLYFGYSVTFVYFSKHPLWICYAARCVHFTAPSGRRGALFFLMEQMYSSGRTFIKKINSFLCHYISMHPGLAESKMQHVRQSHAIKHFLYDGVWESHAQKIYGVRLKGFGI